MKTLLKPDLEEAVCSSCGFEGDLQIEVIQDLWSGYGQLCRVRCGVDSVILKWIQIPQESALERGQSRSAVFGADFGQQRKIKSYQVESRWYQSGLALNPAFRTPALIASGELSSSESYIILEDLSSVKSGEFGPQVSASWNQIKACLQWLASFHKHFLNQHPTNLWKIGTYWHLETRPNEYENLAESDLKSAAQEIDRKLNQASNQTFVHGDAKLANFLFHGDQVAAVDFQYVGGGVGVKDLAYFLSSVYSSDELFEQENICLDTYFSALGLDAEAENEWRNLYPYAWCDYIRFLKGWKPSHPKLHDYAYTMLDKALKELKFE